MDFYDVKGVVEELADGLAVSGLAFEPAEHGALRPGRTARVLLGDQAVGWNRRTPSRGRRAIRPQGAPEWSSPNSNWTRCLARAIDRNPTRPVPVYPPVKEDLASITFTSSRRGMRRCM